MASFRGHHGRGRGATGRTLVWVTTMLAIVALLATYSQTSLHMRSSQEAEAARSPCPPCEQKPCNASTTAAADKAAADKDKPGASASSEELKKLQASLEEAQREADALKKEKEELKKQDEKHAREAEQFKRDLDNRQWDRDKLYNTAEDLFYMEKDALKEWLEGNPKAPLERVKKTVKKPRGIIMSSGGHKYIANGFVTLYIVRHYFGCKLPVAVYYWGASRDDVVNQPTIDFIQSAIPDVELIDASKLPYPKHHRPLFTKYKINEPHRFNGWKVKVFALYEAPFKEVMYLDSDSMPLMDPGPLFELEEFRQYGDLFWPDHWCHRVKIYELVGHDPWDGGKKAWWQAESGQFLYDREKHADVLEWLLFMNTHDEVSYRAALGDKETFHPAFFLAGKDDEYMQTYQAVSHAFVYDDKKEELSYRGFVQHHPNGSLLFLHRSGPAKYDPHNDGDRGVTHVLLQPSCDWNEHWFQFRMTFSWAGKRIYTPEDCKYSFYDPVKMREACGVTYDTAAANKEVVPPVFKIPEDSYMMRTQKAADASFALLRGNKTLNGELF